MLPKHVTFKYNIENDERGSFQRLWDAGSSKVLWKQASFVENLSKGTLRGLHFQENPYSEQKIVTCVKGKIFDVIVDMRKDSENYLKHFTFVLGSNEKFNSILVPKGFAHGYLTLEDNVQLFYMMDEFFSPNHASGIRWDDPALSIQWPITPILISEKDRNLATLP